MIRLGTLFWLVLVTATGFAVFGVKYQVQALEDEFARTKRATLAEEHEIHVLDAEWAYLTRPETLEAMNRRLLSLAPISTKQLHTTAADIPMRPPAPAPVPDPAETVVASAEQPPTPSTPPSAAEAVSVHIQPPAPVNTATDPPPAQSTPPASTEQSVASPQLAKAVPVKAVGKPSPPRRPKSLDDLIAQITASR